MSGRRIWRKRYDWGDLCLAFSAGFLACFLLAVIAAARY